MTVLDVISNNIRRTSYSNYISNFDNTYGQIILDFPIRDTTFLPLSINGLDILSSLDRSIYDSISVVLGISEQYSYKTIGPVMKECFLFYGNGKKIKFNDIYLYSLGNFIFDHNYKPLIGLGKNWCRQGNTDDYTSTNVCKINPDIFRISNPINRFIKDKIIPLLAENASQPWREKYQITIDYDLESYIKENIHEKALHPITSKHLLDSYIEHTLEL